MFLIGISTYTSNAAGAIMIKPTAKSSFKNAVARVTRTATLDGGAVLTNNGFSDGDRKFTVKASLGQAAADLVWDLFVGETYLQLSMEEGFFLMAIERMKIDNGVMNATILIKERIV